LSVLLVYSKVSWLASTFLPGVLTQISSIVLVFHISTPALLPSILAQLAHLISLSSPLLKTKTKIYLLKGLSLSNNSELDLRLPAPKGARTIGPTRLVKMAAKGHLCGSAAGTTTGLMKGGVEGGRPPAHFSKDSTSKHHPKLWHMNVEQHCAIDTLVECHIHATSMPCPCHVHPHKGHAFSFSLTFCRFSMMLSRGWWAKVFSL
jgi:hypothetical protein